MALTPEQLKHYSHFPKESFSAWSYFTQMMSLFFVVRPFYEAKERPLYFNQHRAPGKNLKMIVVSNHLTSSDPPLLTAMLDRPIAFMAKRELFETPVSAFVYRFLKAFAVDRDKPSSDSVKTAFNVLRSESRWCLGIFPEGTRGEPGKLLPFKPGYTAFASKTNTPVLPVGIYYNEQGRYCMNVGHVIMDVTDTEALNEEVYSQICDLIKGN